MEELACGLVRSNNYFLWVVRASEESKLPSNLKAEMSEKGLVVNWCPQLEVLSHQAVGCFMTHCGWNSTLEALSLGVPMVAMPQWTDQTTNAKFVVDVWQAGVRVKVNEKGIVGREEIEVCIKEAMEGERGKELKRNAVKWKVLAKEAVDEAQGHINPMLQFAKRLASKGLRVTLVTTTSASKSMQVQASSVKIEIISDGFNEGEKIDSIDVYLERFKVAVAQSLGELIEKQNSSGYPPKVLVYDSVMTWVLDVARRLGLYGASFFTQNCSVSAIYYHVHHGDLKIPLVGSMVSMPWMPLLKNNDLPSFVYDMDSYPALLNLVVNQFSNLEQVDWILFNSFDKLEEKMVKWMASQWPIKTIGPTVPSMYLDKRLKDDKDYGLSLFKPDAAACMNWLDNKQIGSVVYVSFGSLANLGEDQMEELACGLMRSNSYFLWVVRASEESKLPSNLKADTSEKGLVVNWCPQLEVLSHQAVGCFMTHCGWNSTLEAFSLGIPMVAMPQWTDQTTNAKFLVDVWQAAVRVKVNEKGIVSREEIEICIKEVMEGERGQELKRNAVKWKELAKEAVDEGGSSDKNIEEFVSKLLCT
ncbi:hypothetical protein F0562_006697 [Nyssa sinensis]|uniref:Glycosyltransferase n=1 Tax=Nyssa sinensis TaxID=561372 RepID=A0A5J5AT16_9ASTE|nr:hypothetical protein F0562_006697 [Nyssa sinensis]